MYKNLREYIAHLEREGELARVVSPVSNDLEICEITDRVSKSEGGGKALLFKVEGSDFEVITNMYGSKKRICMALGIEQLEDLTTRIDSLFKEATAPKTNLWDKLKTLPLLADVAKWLPRTSSSRGECQEVVISGADVDLNKLPILKCWVNDGGRFVTLPMVHTIDPESGQRNVGMYRMQVMDEHTTGMHWHLHKTGARHYDGYKRLGKRMPVSVAIGGDPTYAYSATAPMPDNVDEYLLAGFLRGRSVKLVKCITNDIYVPADADFIIEGYVDPTEQKVIEGPFGDHTGFYSLQDKYPLFHVTAITHRRDAIYPATIVGVPPQEDAYIAMATERIFVSPIRFAMQPEMRDMWMPEEGTAHNLALISIEKRYEGQPQKIIQSMWGAGQMMFNKYLVVTDSTINIRNTEQLAEVMRHIDLTRAVVRSEGVLDVLDHATSTLGFGGKLALNATSENIRKSVNDGSYRTNGRIKTCDRWLKRLSLLVVYISPEVDLNLEALVEELDVVNINFVAVFDESTSEMMSGGDLLWLATANSDPRRDIVVSHGGVMVIDARTKLPSKSGNPHRFPNVVTSDVATIELVDRRWNEYGIGEFIESPSRKYRSIILSDSEDV
ncbi:MAG: menaquinone biosynthesis decarboxylase [Rikenellaceae bacterium]